MNTPQSITRPLRPPTSGSISSTATPGWWLAAQRCIAAFMLVSLLPMLALVFIAVKATSPGPFLYSQRRRGLHGRPFNILKIRTMTVGSDNDPQAGLGIRKGDARITPVGGILRDLKIDELPQLWNVMRGEMEFVGPRAIADSLHEKLSREIPRFPIRYCVRPGLTNLGQISIFDNASQENVVDDWRRRFEAEWEFIRHKSVSLDILTGLMTIVFLFRKVLRPILGANLNAGRRQRLPVADEPLRNETFVPNPAFTHRAPRL